MKMATGASSSSSMFRLSAIVVMAAAIVAVLISTSEARDHMLPQRPRAVSCSTLIPALIPCRGYLVGSEANPPSGCCNGVKGITKDQSPSKQDLVAACNCIKQAVPLLGKYDANRIPLISQQCGFSFHLPAITQNTDCSKAVMGGF